jgi:hypothetical protein
VTAVLSITYWTGIDIPDIAEEGVGHLIVQYGPNAPRVEAFLRAFLDEAADLDEVTLKTLAGIWPATAVGVQLDLIGKIVIQDRGEFGDDEYRILLLGRIFVNKSNGTLPEFLELLVGILGLAEPMVMREHYPAELLIEITDMPYAEPVLILLDDMSPAGVRMNVVCSERPRANVFSTSGDFDTPEYDSDRGTANFAGTTGGHLAGLRIL